MNEIKLYYQAGERTLFKWQCIHFSDGSNPYICKTEKEFNRLNKKYNLLHLGGCIWKTI